MKIAKKDMKAFLVKQPPQKLNKSVIYRELEANSSSGKYIDHLLYIYCFRYISFLQTGAIAKSRMYSPFGGLPLDASGLSLFTIKIYNVYIVVQCYKLRAYACHSTLRSRAKKSYLGEN